MTIFDEPIPEIPEAPETETKDPEAPPDEE